MRWWVVLGVNPSALAEVLKLKNQIVDQNKKLDLTKLPILSQCCSTQ